MKTIKYLIAWPLTHATYQIGDKTSILLDAYCKRVEANKMYDPDKDDKIADLLYRFYSWVMCKSCDFNDWGGLTLWSKPISGVEEKK